MEIVAGIVGTIAVLIGIAAGIAQILDYIEKRRQGRSASPEKPKLSTHAKPQPIPARLNRQASLEQQSLADFNKLASDNVRHLMRLADFEGFAIDDCVMIAGSEDFKGWSAEEIEVSIEDRDISLPPELQQVVDAYRDSITRPWGNFSSYRVLSLSPWLTDKPRVQIKLAPIEFYTYFVICSLLDEPVLKTPQGEQVTIRQKFGQSVVVYNTVTYPPIPTNVSIHPVIVSEDDKVLLMQRSGHLPYYPNAWSASLEETMRAPSIFPDRFYPGDGDFIEGALRGIHEELGPRLSVRRDDVRVLSFCVEYPTLSFDVLCVARVHATSDEIKNSWLLIAPDKHEARRLRAVPFQLDAMLQVLFEDKVWHPTSRMRLLQLLFHKYGPTTTISAITPRLKSN